MSNSSNIWLVYLIQVRLHLKNHTFAQFCIHQIIMIYLDNAKQNDIMNSWTETFLDNVKCVDSDSCFQTVQWSIIWHRWLFKLMTY